MAKLIEDVAEHVGRISQELRDRYPEVPWSKVQGMRRLLVHEYHRLDVGVLARTVHHDLPALIRELERISRGLD